MTEGQLCTELAWSKIPGCCSADPADFVSFFARIRSAVTRELRSRNESGDRLY